MTEIIMEKSSKRLYMARLAGIIAIFLGTLNILGVITFHFPEYLTTPEVRKAYSIETIRLLMSVTLLVSITAGLTTIILGKVRNLGLIGISLSIMCMALGGPFVPVGDFPENTPYIGLDWLILDLLGSAIIFIIIEKAFPYRKDQPTIREEWGLDMIHFTVNHLLIGISLLVANNFAPIFFGWAQWSVVQNFVNGLPFLVELFLCVLVADLIQYAVHRCLHIFPWLWRIHSVHHCPHFMDWLSGSRQHFIELVITRSMVLVPIFVLGFERTIIDAYVIIVGFQAVLNHTNAQFNFGFLEKIIVTPQFHHWHHSSDRVAIDRNFAAHFSFIDTIFGSRVKSDVEWPEKYGITGRQLPPKYLSHMIYPFKSSFWKKDMPPK